MSDVTVVGSIAFDAVETPSGDGREKMLGGAATHFSLASAFFATTRVVGPVGDDFGDAEFKVMQDRGVITDDIERVAGGKTFFWKGRYLDANHRETLQTDLNVFETFDPKLSAASAGAETLFLANIVPALQIAVREQCTAATFTALDSMNLWIDIARDDLVRAIGMVDCLLLNDEELRQLTGEAVLVRAARAALELGPRVVIAKQGEYGVAMFTADDVFGLPAYPTPDVIDPTGAGDTFAGGFVGYVAAHGTDDLRAALAYGTALASFNVEAFGTERLQTLTAAEVDERVEALGAMTRFDASPTLTKG